MIILIRSHYVDARLANMASRIANSTNAGVYLLLDERAGPIPCEPLRKISLNDDVVAKLQLRVTDDYAWRCGDYALFAARAMHPDEDEFWMIEHDVRINFKDLVEFSMRRRLKITIFWQLTSEKRFPNGRGARAWPITRRYTNAYFRSSGFPGARWITCCRCGGSAPCMTGWDCPTMRRSSRAA